MRSRKHRTDNRSVQGVHEDSSTELTTRSRKKTILEVPIRVMDANNTYSCHAFHADLPNGKASGSMAVLPYAVEFEVRGFKHQLPFNGLEVRLGGASDRLVFFSHPRVPDWHFYTAERKVLKHVHLREHAELAPQLAQARKVRVWNKSVFAGVILLFVAVPVLFFSQLGNLTALAVSQVPPQWEQNLGESVHAQYRLGAEVMDQKETDALLQPLVAPLLQALPNNPYPFEFYIVNNPQLNAFALPGGYVTIHSGLILKAESAEELLGVLAHEIIHITEQHGMRNIVSSAGTYLVIGAIFGDVSGILGTVAAAAPLLLNQGYSRDFEREADDRGYDLLLAANIDPSGLSRFFEKLVEEENKQLAQIENEKTREVVKDSLGFLSSHPATQERIATLKKREARVDQDFQRFDAEFTRLQASVQAFVAKAEPQKEDISDEN